MLYKLMYTISLYMTMSGQRVTWGGTGGGGGEGGRDRVTEGGTG